MKTFRICEAANRKENIPMVHQCRKKDQWQCKNNGARHSYRPSERSKRKKGESKEEKKQSMAPSSEDEEGARIIFILLSPDGGLGIVKLENTPDNITDPKAACEFKCPVGTDYKTPVHYEIPVRHVSQLLAEMASTGTKELVYLSWSAESSTVFQVSFDEELWKMIIDEALSVYSTESPKRPTRISEAAKNIKRKLYSFKQEHTELLCEVKSAKATSLNISQSHT
ncbi:ARPC1A_B [Mytilus coruscus]|uniref:ARPC1A_B n=1 Tax=Mytilus coruscus TaxID=42192 RepID=A0A6J8AW64_MYTCO|nr:ARPC1A_B [Mytilus coruscus]